MSSSVRNNAVRMPGILGVGLLFTYFRGRIAITWLFVLFENILMALLPLFIGRAIDALLGQQTQAFWELAAVMAALTIVAVGRRVYDTRCYGTMRAQFGAELIERTQNQPVSRSNARLDMSREMVDFLEEHVPELITAVVQLLVSIVILWTFDSKLGLSAVVVLASLGLIYGLFHRRFYRLNGDLNSQRELQVNILEQRQRESLLKHLMRLRHHEVKLSDTDAGMYGLIFAGMFAFVLTNLWFASTIPVVTAGTLFAIISYSWEFVEAGIGLPMTLQQWSRLTEIRERLNEEPEKQHQV